MTDARVNALAAIELGVPDVAAWGYAEPLSERFLQALQGPGASRG